MNIEEDRNRKKIEQKNLLNKSNKLEEDIPIHRVRGSKVEENKHQQSSWDRVHRKD